ncbi:MAG: hypothetical protein ACJ78Q_17940 [Chloroflexia bacterium]|jgi:hypothetical protein
MRKLLTLRFLIGLLLLTIAFVTFFLGPPWSILAWLVFGLWNLYLYLQDRKRGAKDRQ